MLPQDIWARLEHFEGAVAAEGAVSAPGTVSSGTRVVPPAPKPALASPGTTPSSGATPSPPKSSPKTVFRTGQVDEPRCFTARSSGTSSAPLPRSVARGVCNQSAEIGSDGMETGSHDPCMHIQENKQLQHIPFRNFERTSCQASDEQRGINKEEFRAAIEMRNRGTEPARFVEVQAGVGPSRVRVGEHALGPRRTTEDSCPKADYLGGSCLHEYVRGHLVGTPPVAPSVQRDSNAVPMRLTLQRSVSDPVVHHYSFSHKPVAVCGTLPDQSGKQTSLPAAYQEGGNALQRRPLNRIVSDFVANHPESARRCGTASSGCGAFQISRSADRQSGGCTNQLGPPLNHSVPAAEQNRGFCHMPTPVTQGIGIRLPQPNEERSETGTAQVRSPAHHPASSSASSSAAATMRFRTDPQPPASSPAATGRGRTGSRPPASSSTTFMGSRTQPQQGGTMQVRTSDGAGQIQLPGCSHDIGSAADFLGPVLITGLAGHTLKQPCHVTADPQPTAAPVQHRTPGVGLAGPSPPKVSMHSARGQQQGVDQYILTGSALAAAVRGSVADTPVTLDQQRSTALTPQCATTISARIDHQAPRTEDVRIKGASPTDPRQRSIVIRQLETAIATAPTRHAASSAIEPDRRATVANAEAPSAMVGSSLSGQFPKIAEASAAMASSLRTWQMQANSDAAALVASSLQTGQMPANAGVPATMASSSRTGQLSVSNQHSAMGVPAHRSAVIGSDASGQQPATAQPAPRFGAVRSATMVQQPVASPARVGGAAVQQPTAAVQQPTEIPPASFSRPGAIDLETLESDAATVTDVEDDEEVDDEPPDPISIENRIDKLGLPESIEAAYKARGITKLYGWQAECLATRGVSEGRNLVYCAPTSGGKTIVSEIVMLRRVANLQKSAIFVLPYVSIVMEKSDYLNELCQKSKMKVKGFYGGSLDGIRDKFDIAVCTIEKANSLVNKMIEDGTLAEKLCTIVVDELHLVGDGSRGYLLEVTLSKVQYLAEDVQVLGMSATLPNIKDIARWLKARLYATDYRPVPLSENVLCDGQLLDTEGNVTRPLPSEGLPDPPDWAPKSVMTAPPGPGSDAATNAAMVAATYEVTKQGHSVLVFCSSKFKCEKAADLLAQKLPLGPNEEKHKLAREKILDAMRQQPTGTDPTLLRSIPRGAAFHHGGLASQERKLIERGFREGTLVVLCATSTLAAGVNLPARRVIFQTPFMGNKFLDSTQYKQMAGRAGRAGQGTVGESVIIANSRSKKQILDLVTKTLPCVASCLGNDQRGLKRLLLEVLSITKLGSGHDLIRFCRCTLLEKQKPPGREQTGDPIKDHPEIAEAVQWLLSHDMLRVEGRAKSYSVTPLGRAVCASSLEPFQGYQLFQELERARPCICLDTDLHVCYLVTPTESQIPVDWKVFNRALQHLSAAERRVCENVGVRLDLVTRAEFQGKLTSKVRESADGMRLHRFFTALVLWALLHEVPVPIVLQRFGVGRGHLQSLQQAAASYTQIVATFCGKLQWHPLEALFLTFQQRLSFGVRQELVPLMQIEGMDCIVARALYEQGFTTPVTVASARPAEILRVLRRTLPTGVPSAALPTENADRLVELARDSAKAAMQEKTKRAHEAQKELKQTMLEEQRAAKRRRTERATQASPVLGNVQQAPRRLSLGRAPELARGQKRDILGCHLANQSHHDQASAVAGLNNSLRTRARIAALNIAAAGGEQIPELKPCLQRRSEIILQVKTPESIPDARALPNEQRQGARQLPATVATVASVEPPSTPCRLPGAGETSVFEDLVATPDPGLRRGGEPTTTQRMALFDTPGVSEAGGSPPTNVLTPQRLGIGLQRIGRHSLTPEDVDAATGSHKNNSRTRPACTPESSRTAARYRADIAVVSFRRFMESPFAASNRSSVYALPTLEAIEAVRDDNFLLAKLQQCNFLGVGLVVDGNDVVDALCITMSPAEAFCLVLSEAAPIPVPVRDWFQDPRHLCITAEAKALVGAMLRRGVDVCCALSEPRIATWLLDPDKAQYGRVADVASQLDVKVHMPRIMPGAGVRKPSCLSGAAASRLSAPARNRVESSWPECFLTVPVMAILASKLQVQGLLDSFWNVEMPFAAVLAWMEHFGLGCERRDPSMTHSHVMYRIAAIQEKIRQLVGRTVLLTSSEDVGRALFEDLLLPLPRGVKFPRKNNGRLAFRSSVEVLKRMQSHPMVGLVKEFRQLSHVARRFESIFRVNGQPRPDPPCGGLCGSTCCGENFMPRPTEQDTEGQSPPSTPRQLPRLRVDFVQTGTATGRISTGSGSFPILCLENPFSMSEVIRSSVHEEMAKGKVPEQGTRVFVAVASSPQSGPRHLREGVLQELCETTCADSYPGGEEPLAFYWVSHGWSAYEDATFAQEVHQVRVGHGQTILSYPADKVWRMAAPIFMDDQNAPVLRVNPRNLIVATAGRVLLSVDYSQLEVRIMAHFSQDPRIVSILRGTGDVFRHIAAGWLQKPETDITAEERSGAKRICYGLLYGIGPGRLAAELGISRVQATEFQESFMHKYTGIAAWVKSCRDCARQCGYVETLRNRRRYLPNLSARAKADRAHAERQAVNTSCQACAADLVKTAMITIHERLKNMRVRPTENGSCQLAARMVLQVHDELVFEVHEPSLEAVREMVVTEMIAAGSELRVPLQVKWHVGRSFGTMT